MVDENLQRAKEIFFQYACNHFYLNREVEAVEYKRFDISKEQEKIWYREYVSYWTGKLSLDDLVALNHLRDAYAEEALPELLRLSTLGDSFAKLSFANTIWDIAYGGMMSPFMREKSRRKAVFIWQALLNNPIELTDSHSQLVTEDNILNYARNKLEESKKRNGIYFLFISIFMGIISVATMFIDLVDKTKRLGKGKRQKS